MLAVVGYLTTIAGYRIDGLENVPAGIQALPEMPTSVKLQMVATVAVLEMIMRDVTGKNDFVGDYRNGFIDFGWDSFDDATKTKKRTIELNNGRAAMMGIAGLMVHEVLGVSILPGGVLP